jgi:hypothetical protein
MKGTTEIIPPDIWHAGPPGRRVWVWVWAWVSMCTYCTQVRYCTYTLGRALVVFLLEKATAPAAMSAPRKGKIFCHQSSPRVALRCVPPSPWSLACEGGSGGYQLLAGLDVRRLRGLEAHAPTHALGHCWIPGSRPYMQSAGKEASSLPFSQPLSTHLHISTGTRTSNLGANISPAPLQKALPMDSECGASILLRRARRSSWT